MGAGNVALVFARWSVLPDREFRVLSYMALVSLDRDNPPRYFGGREKLAEALGRMLPAGPAADDASPDAIEARRRRAAAFEAVRAAVEALRSVGAVELLSGGVFGRAAVYGLRLWTDTDKAQALPGSKAQARPAPKAQAAPGRDTGPACAQAQAPPAPEEEVGAKGTAEETNTGSRTTSGSVDEVVARAFRLGANDQEKLQPRTATG